MASLLHVILLWISKANTDNDDNEIEFEQKLTQENKSACVKYSLMEIVI